MTGAKSRGQATLNGFAHRHYASPVVLGDGHTKEFALPVTVLRTDDVQVFVNGLLQHVATPGAANDYAVRGFTPAYAGDKNRIKFTAAPANNAKIMYYTAGG